MPTLNSCGIAVACLTAAVSAAVARAVDVAGMRFLAEHAGTAFYVSDAGRIESVYGAAFSGGGTPEESAALFVVAHADVLGARAMDLEAGSTMTASGPTQQVMFDPATGRSKFTLVYYAQARGGIPVFRADLRLLVRNEAGYPLELVKSALRDLGDFAVPGAWQRGAVTFKGVQEAIRRDDAALVQMALRRTVIWAGYDDTMAAPRLAYEVLAENGPDTSPAYRSFLYLVDALSGAVVFKEDQVLQRDVTGQVQGLATTGVSADTCGPEEATGLAYLRVSGGATSVYADALGNFLFPTNGAPEVTLTTTLQGRYFNVTDTLGALESLQQTLADGSSAVFLHNAANSTERIRAEVNGYVFANQVRDYALRYCPSYPTVSTQLAFPVRVDLAGSCNAFYGSGAINFYRAGGGCPNFAFGDIVHHEYGHHLVAMGGSGQGAYGEGTGDAMGTLISDLPTNGIGAFGDCNQAARTADNTLQYPCSSEIHTCGQLMSGCIWATRNQLAITNPSTYRDIIGALGVNAILLHQGQVIAPFITIDYLTLDDDDSNILNGTPHYQEIATGFTQHNMDPPTSIALIAFRFPDGRPEMVNPDGTTALRVGVVPVAGTPRAGSARLYVDTGSGYQPVPVTETVPNTYDAAFPAVACGALVRYYVTAESTTGATYAAPAAAPLVGYTATAAADGVTVFADDFQSDTGWVVGAPGDSPAPAGAWTRVEPVGTYAQPELDHSGAAGGMCFVTGQGVQGGVAFANDVDQGTMTLTSPVFDLSGAARARLSYWRWFYNHRGTLLNTADTFVVQVSNDDGASWTTVETVGPTGAGTAGGWVQNELDVGTLLQPTALMRVRFRATDTGVDDVVEAAVDDVTVRAFTCAPPACRADWNHDGVVGSQDFFDFLGDFFADRGEFNGDGVVNSQDLFDFLVVFLGGC